MNSILCHMKLGNAAEMIPLCNEVLCPPKHGYNVEDMEIKGPRHYKL